MNERLRDLVRGFTGNLKFSNRLWLTYNRCFRRRARAVTYIWRNRLYIVCDCAHQDHNSVQEIFAERAYEPFLAAAAFPGNRLRYINVGANVGAFDLMLFDRGMKIESGLAVELNPHTFQRCLLNLQTNHITNTRVINCGVAGRDGFIDFVPSNSSLGDNIFTAANPAASTSAASERIELLALETLLQRYAPATPEFDLLKLDCEGAEYSIFKNTPVEVLRRFRYIVTEFHPEPAGESIHAAYQRLAEAGFTSRRGQPGNFPFMDLFTRG